MRAILTGGGSGGHVNPALAIADIIKTNDPTSEIIFVGTKRGLENTLVPKAGYELRHIDISGIRRSLSPQNLKTAVKIFTSQKEAKALIRDFRPDIVIGTGGYACWPCVKVASDMGVPTMLHEANAIPGFAVKRLASRVDVMLTNFDDVKELQKCKKRVHVGMPMRGEFERISKQEARKALGLSEKQKHVILSFGGSLGAPMVNRAALEVMRDLSSKRDDVVHFHSSGSREYDNARATFCEWGLDGKENLVLSDYIYDMSLKMAAADVVICRSGAMTLAELSRLGSAAVLIPSPNVTHNHQFENAKVLSDAGAAIIVEEKDFDGEVVTKAVRELIDDNKKREKMAENIKKFCDMDTNAKIYKEIVSLVSSKK